MLNISITKVIISLIVKTTTLWAPSWFLTAFHPTFPLHFLKV